MKIVLCTLVIALTGSPAGAARAVPATSLVKPGTCAFTTIKRVDQRLVDGRTGEAIPNSGSAVTLANGVDGVSYDQIPAVEASLAGDRVMTCLVSLPQHCPPGDRRGRVYTTTNLRTEQSWTLPDAEHRCGGA